MSLDHLAVQRGAEVLTDGHRGAPSASWLDLCRTSLPWTTSRVLDACRVFLGVNRVVDHDPPASVG